MVTESGEVVYWLSSLVLFTKFSTNFFMFCELAFTTKKDASEIMKTKGFIKVTAFTENVIKLIQKIPQGKVMTYGQIARFAGSPRGARQVVRILHSMSKKHELPWHRVINAKGQIAIQDDELFHVQKLSLEIEGVVVNDHGRIDLTKYLWEPLE